jgi:hypothetical protein
MTKKLLSLFIASFFISATLSAQAVCNANGNVIIYSNYDGGPLTINVDQNIPNLKIGIVSYEFARINITGPYAANVTEVRWAGYNGTNNHCSLSTPYATSITGVANSVDTIIVMPPAAYANPNGYNIIICNYSCSSTTNQGGCNTPDQIAHYFLTAFSGVLYYHHTQYGCWTGTYNVSTGGNCCIDPLTTSIGEQTVASQLVVTPNPSNGNFTVALPTGIATGEIKIYNTLGEEIRSVNASSSTTVSLEGEAAGIYFIKLLTENAIYSQRIIIAE